MDFKFSPQILPIQMQTNGLNKFVGGYKHQKVSCITQKEPKVEHQYSAYKKRKLQISKTHGPYQYAKATFLNVLVINGSFTKAKSHSPGKSH